MLSKLKPCASMKMSRLPNLSIQLLNDDLFAFMWVQAQWVTRGNPWR